ncbi:hypothetical protein [Actinospongicola halichondriae]|uniref:hypothetical protein n=1 Tax=Actinospongicola halichondriae TaxID=3236844 RepID=UPI003D44C405
MKRFHTILAVLLSSAFLFGFAACGGDDDADTGAAATEDDAAVDDDSGAEPVGGDDDGGASGPVGASVTIDGTTYTASEELVCVTLGGGLSAQFIDRDTGIDIDVDLPPEDWETDTDEDWDPPSVRVDVVDESQFESGRTDVIVGMPETSVASYSIDGNHATGEGDFVDVFSLPAEAVTVTGSFDVTCADK